MYAQYIEDGQVEGTRAPSNTTNLKKQPSVVHSNSAPANAPSAKRSSNTKTTIPSVKKQPYRSVNTYLDRITIVGIHNYLYARGKYEKITWKITFLVAIVVTIYYLVQTVREYQQSTIVLDIQHQTEPSLRLPNPWVCHAATNTTYLREPFEKVRHHLEADKRVQLFARRYRSHLNLSYPVNYDHLTYVALDFMTSTPVWVYEDNWKEENGRSLFVFEFISKVIEAMGSNWTGVKEYYEKGLLRCGSIVMNCSLNDMPFDCCRDGQLGYNRLVDKCVVLNIRREVVEKRIQQNQSKPIELKFETIISDPSATYFPLVFATTATKVSFGNRVDALFDYSLPLQGGSQSTVTVKGTKKKKLANCMDSYKYRQHLHSNTHPVIQGYFEDMTHPDRYNVEACQMGKLFEALFLKCGCVPYYDSMRPQKDTDICTPAHAYACIYRAFQNEPMASSTGTDGVPATSAPEVDQKRDMFRDIKDRTQEECLQLCESWIYDYTVFSSNIDDLEGNTSSINRTRITIVFDPEYRVETEMYKMDPDAFIASLGDALGLILGFSAVTLIQLPIWSIVACVYKRKQSKVAAMGNRKQEDDARAAHALRLISVHRSL